MTGFLTVGKDAAIEPEVDLAGYWIDGDVVRVGEIRIGARARIGARSTLAPGADIGKESEIAPGSLVLGEVPSAEFWSGSPAERQAKARGPWSRQEPPKGGRWLGMYGVVALLIASLPAAALAAGGAVLWPVVHDTDSLAALVRTALPWLPLAAFVGYVVLLGLIVGLVRLFAIGLEPGHFPVRSAAGIRIWGTLRVLDEARTWLFPLYSSALTPVWLRALGAKIGSGRRGVHGAADPQVRTGQRPRVPRRRHPDRRLRARRWLDPRRAGQDRQARLRRQLRDGVRRSSSAQVVARRRPFGGTATGRGQGGVVLAGQPADQASPVSRGDRHQPDLRAAQPAQALPRARGDLADGADDARRTPQPRRRRHVARVAGLELLGGTSCWPGS